MDATLLQIFATEQSEHVQRMRQVLESLDSVAPGAHGAAFDELLRRAHTLKGAARAVGLEETEQLVHRLEGVVAQWRRADVLPAAEARLPVLRALDMAEDLLAWAMGTRSRPDAESALRGLGGSSEPEAVMPVAAPAAAVVAPPVVAGPELVRVDTSLLDAVVRSASQLLHATHDDDAASRQAVEHADALSNLLHDYTRLRRNAGRFLREHSGSEELQPVLDLLELLDAQLPALASAARRGSTVQEQRSRMFRLLAEVVHDNAFRARMTPAETVFQVFGAMVRELAAQEGKEITFRAEGMQVQADRDVLQALKDPVMHLLRNAVSHGIEPAAERAESGKAPAGLVTLTVEVREERLEVTVADDGRGLDVDALARQAVARGAVTEASLANASADTLARLIFLPGLSTSATVNRLSGRGMGLSAVMQTVQALRGDIRVRQQRGRGMAITISAPMSLSTQEVLLLRESGQTFAIPLDSVEQLRRFSPAEVHLVDGRECLEQEGRPVPLFRLAALLGLPMPERKSETATRSGGPMHQAALLGSGDSSVAVVVEELLAARETLIKESGLPQRLAGWSTGAVALEDGSVAVMLSSDRILHRLDSGVVVGQPVFQAVTEDRPKTRVLVVDDSVTTRSMERSLLEAHGFDVTVAVDGAEAWDAIRRNPPQLVISDVNMPHMDGFQLLERVKSEGATKHIPVILVTSLESREEQEKGLLLGADAYIVKRKFDQRELLQVVRQII